MSIAERCRHCTGWVIRAKRVGDLAAVTLEAQVDLAGAWELRVESGQAFAQSLADGAPTPAPGQRHERHDCYRTRRVEGPVLRLVPGGRY